jgi:hypothetical protein
MSEATNKIQAKACGIAQAAILMIDRYGNCAPRHYENLPHSGAKE